MDAEDIGLALFLGSLMFIGFVAMIGGFLHARKERLLTHAERMKAIELGQPLPEDPGTSRARVIAKTAVSAEAPEVSPQMAMARKCIGSIIWVVFWGVLFGAPAGAASKEVGIAIGVAVGAIGVTLAICGTILASKAPTPPTYLPTYKTQTDPDAYDVAGRRG
jgi:hypothetical protein